MYKPMLLSQYIAVLLEFLEEKGDGELCILTDYEHIELMEYNHPARFKDITDSKYTMDPEIIVLIDNTTYD